MLLIVADCNSNKWWRDVANPMTPMINIVIINNNCEKKRTGIIAKFTQNGGIVSKLSRIKKSLMKNHIENQWRIFM